MLDLAEKNALSALDLCPDLKKREALEDGSPRSQSLAFRARSISCRASPRLAFQARKREGEDEEILRQSIVSVALSELAMAYAQLSACYDWFSHSERDKKLYRVDAQRATEAVEARARTVELCGRQSPVSRDLISFARKAGDDAAELHSQVFPNAMPEGIVWTV